MHFRLRTLSLLLLAFTACSSQKIYRWVPFVGPKPERLGAVPNAAKAEKGNPYGPITGTVAYGLEMRVTLSPDTIKLPDTRSFEARIVLINRTKKAVTLQFNDSREYDFLLQDASGKKLVQWTDDQPVNQNPGYVIVNPGERSEFVGTISTRDMVAGRPYVLQASLVGYPKLMTTINITPQK
jgi:Intracellular proteinase inhibitor